MSRESPSPEGDDLDFTRPAAKPAPPPAPEKLQQAREEAAGVAPQLDETGYYVSIARHAEAKIPPKSGDKYVLLVVDDDNDLAQLVIDIFIVAGFTVRWASNRAEINKELKYGHEVDVMLLDIGLPDADGLQILGRLRTHPRFGTMPVIMMTAKADPPDVVQGLALGADGYVSKPFNMSGLVKAVNQVLGRA